MPYLGSSVEITSRPEHNRVCLFRRNRREVRRELRIRRDNQKREEGLSSGQAGQLLRSHSRRCCRFIHHNGDFARWIVKHLCFPYSHPAFLPKSINPSDQIGHYEYPPSAYIERERQVQGSDASLQYVNRGFPIVRGESKGSCAKARRYADGREVPEGDSSGVRLDQGKKPERKSSICLKAVAETRERQPGIFTMRQSNMSITSAQQIKKKHWTPRCSVRVQFSRQRPSRRRWPCRR